MVPALMMACGGCTLTAPIPGGPLRPDNFTTVQTTWAYAYGPAKGSQNGDTVSGNGQTVGRGGDLGAVVPISLGLRQSLRSSLELAGDIGWLSSGIEVRAGTPGGTGPWPFAISAGFRSSVLSIGIDENNPPPTYEGRVRFELYPRLRADRDGGTWLMLSAGVSYGLFEHSIEGPAQDGDVPDFAAHFVIARPEARLELSIGVDYRVRSAEVRFAIAPWILLDAGAPTDRCGSGCPPIDSFSQSWGVSFLFSPSLGGDLISRTRAVLE
jgi:hypothetical protein